MADLGFDVLQEDYGASRVDGMRRCNYDLSRVSGMRSWLTVLNATLSGFDVQIALGEKLIRILDNPDNPDNLFIFYPCQVRGEDYLIFRTFKCRIILR